MLFLFGFLVCLAEKYSGTFAIGPRLLFTERNSDSLPFTAAGKISVTGSIAGRTYHYQPIGHGARIAIGELRESRARRPRSRRAGSDLGLLQATAAKVAYPKARREPLLPVAIGFWAIAIKLLLQFVVDLVARGWVWENCRHAAASSTYFVPTCRSHAVRAAYHVLRSLKLPTAALHLVECTFRRGFKSYSAHHLLKYLPTTHAVERQPGDFSSCNRHFIRHGVSLGVHRGADVGMSH